MKKLPVIVGFGGINPAGRSSFHHSYRRMVYEKLSKQDTAPMFQGLASLMGLDASEDNQQHILDHTLIRKIESQTFDLTKMSTNCKASLNSTDTAIQFKINRKELPRQLPANWKILEDGSVTNKNEVHVTITGELNVMIPDTNPAKVSSAGQLPTGFDAGALYNSRNQPKGLQLTVFGASDAINSIGIDWDTLLQHIQPDQVSVYAGSAIGQLDDFGGRGLSQSWLKGGRISSKQMPLMLSQMPADFINSYMINSVGATGTNMGACATFLYNLRQGIHDIQSGRTRITIVGGAEAPIEPEVIEGFRAMGALSEDAQIAKLDGTETTDYRRSCRPFSDNAGFAISEASQFFVLMDDELALEVGATIYGSVPEVFVNADANKKSISSPGIGNYITVAKAMSLAKQLLGEEGVKQTFVQAHGTGTPQNRVSESHILNEVAKTFDIEKWPVCAIKSYLGHSLGPAGGDQLTASLGAWEYGLIPGINSIDHLADDVFDSNLEFCLSHKSIGEKGHQMKAALLNSKGFGGNNATGLVLSPSTTLEMLENKHGVKVLSSYYQKNVSVKQQANEYDQSMIKGDFNIIYDFGTNVMDENDLNISTEGIQFKNFSNDLLFSTENTYSDYC